jgi:peptidoglycan/xylan/chitin deacetylase (PgdA/CDA1 family)
MPIRNKREFLAGRLRDAGVLRLLELAAKRAGLLVLVYHRIGDPESDPFYDPIVSATPDAFRDQVRYLRDHFRLIGVEELLAIADGGFRVPGPTALITFDDGYRDNLALALPVLRDLGAPALLFLATGFLLRPRLPWWDHVAYAVKASRRNRLAIEVPEALEVDLAHTDRREAMMTVIRAFLRAEHPDDPALLAHLADRAGVDVDAEALGRELFLSWDQARQLASSGVDIGSHTQDHPHLARLPEDAQRRELAESRRTLEQELGREVTTFAYPFGHADAFDATTRRLARESGYRVAFSLKPRLNLPGATDPLDVSRFGIGPTDTPVLFRARMALATAFGRSPL